MFRPLSYVLERTVTTGHLKMIAADGSVCEFGDRTGSPVIARISDKRTERQLALNAPLAIGEAYMEGRLVFEQGTLYDFLELLLTNVPPRRWPRWLRLVDTLAYVTRRLQHYNPVGRARRNVAHHYDIDGSLYDLFLDTDLQYSCAYFERPDMTLEEAQEAKKRHLAAKLALRPGQTVLDIGCGFGGLGLYLARNLDVDVLGITLSEEQLAIATERAHAEGLSRAGPISSSGTTASSASASTGSFQSACSSMSASIIIAPSSTSAQRS